MTDSADTDPLPIAAAGVVCVRGHDVLLVRRAKPPLQGQWSLPGGKIRYGETAHDAALRELAEETGVTAEMVDLIDVVDALPRAPDSPHHVLVDFAVRWTGGEPVAGDDAAEARFFPVDEAVETVEWEETRRVIRAGIARVKMGEGTF